MTKVVLIGSGAVATSLAAALRDKTEITQVFSRTLDHAQQLASTIDGCSATARLSELDPNADVYIIAVKDDAIADVLSDTPDNGALWLHTSGSTPVSVFEGRRLHYGVLYPMQSFSRTLTADMSRVHIFVEGADEATTQQITELARLMSEHVKVCGSEERERLHIAAVFACNFTNHLWTLASDLLAEKGLDFQAMMPLIGNTVDKLNSLSPEQSQTGPAARGDRRIIERHLSQLEGTPRDIYRLLSDSIMNRHKQQ